MGTALWAADTQKCATTWCLQYFMVGIEHMGAEEDEDKEVNGVHIWRGL